MKHVVLLLIIILLNLTNTYSQSWERTYGGPADDIGYIISGYEGHFSNANVLLIKTNEFGDTLWTKTYGNDSCSETSNSVIQTKDSGYLIFGTYQGVSILVQDVLVIKTNNNGDTTWTKKVGSPGCFEASLDAGKIDDANFISLSGGCMTVGVTKIDSVGNQLLYRGCIGPAFGYSIVSTIDSCFTFTGEDDDPFFMSDSCNVFLFKADSNGDSLWCRFFGGNLRDAGYSVIQTNDNGFIIAGLSESFGAGSTDIYLIKTSNITTSYHEIRISEPELLVYPNPNNGKFSLKYDNYENLPLSITLTDLQGKVIYFEKINGRITDKTININKYSKGVYILRVSGNKINLSKKIILLK